MADVRTADIDLGRRDPAAAEQRARAASAGDRAAGANGGVGDPQIRAGLELARGAGLSASGFLIVGHPGDNEQESAVTRGFVDRLFQDELIPWLDLSTFSPYPGTPYFNQPERHGIEILVRDWNLWRRTNRPVAQLVNYPAEAIYLNLLRLLAVQDAHVRGRIGPPALGSGAGAT